MPTVISFKTGRSRTLRFAGSLTALVAADWTYFPLDEQKHTKKISRFLLNWHYAAILLETEATDVAQIGLIEGNLTVAIGNQVDIQQWDGTLWDLEFGPGGGTESDEKDFSGTFEIEYEVEEWQTVTIDDFPTHPETGGTRDYSVQRTTSTVFEERVVPGSTATVTATFGPLTASASETMTPFVLGSPPLTPLHAVGCDLRTLVDSYRAHPDATPAGVNHTTSWSGDINGMVVADHIEYSRTGPGGSVDGSSPQTVYAEVAPSGGIVENILDSLYFLPRSYKLLGRLRAMSEPYPSSLDAKVSKVYTPDPADAETITLSPGHESEWVQDRWSADSVIANVAQSSASVDQFTPVRAWLDGSTLSSAGEDTRDWRLLFLGKRYAWARTQHEDLILPGSGASRSFDPKVIAEAYRYLAVRVRSVGSDSAACTVAIGGKEWTIQTGADGVWVTRLIDLCCPENTTGTIEDKAVRHPLDGPDGEPEDEPDLWGVARIEALSVTSSETIEVDTLTLKREYWSRLTYLPAFDPFYHAWASPTDNTYRKAGAWSDVDGRIADLAHVAKVVPTNGQPTTYTVYALDDLAAFLGLIGWTVTDETTDPDIWHTGSRPAAWAGGGGALFDHALGEFTEMIDVESQDAHTQAQALYDSVQGYPGCGRGVWDGSDYDSLEPALPLIFSKVLRAQGWGLVFDQDDAPTTGAIVKAIEVGPPEVAAGQGASDTIGYYRTGLPYARGNRDVRSELQLGDRPSSENRWHNRFRWRVAFREALEAAGWHLCWTPVGLMFAVRCSSTAVEVWRFDFRGEDQTFTAYEGEDLVNAQVAWQPSGAQLAILLVEGSTARLIRSASWGEDWSMPTTISPAENGAIAIDDQLGIEYYAIHDGTDWTCWRRETVSGDATEVGTIIAGVAEGNAGLEVSPEAGRRLVFVYDDGGVRKRRISTDQGETWATG